MSEATLVTIDKSLASTFLVNETPCMAAIPKTPTPKTVADTMTSMRVKHYVLSATLPTDNTWDDISCAPCHFAGWSEGNRIDQIGNPRALNSERLDGKRRGA
jgi:hypothetical protein